MSEKQWITLLRPGYLGKHRDAKYAEWNAAYGAGNWRLAWLVNGNPLDFLGACVLYEDAYYAFLQASSEIVTRLVTEAANVYDDEESNVASGLDYTKQETGRTHIQDIAIRRALVRLGVWFKGSELIRIRQEKGTHLLSIILSPGYVPFHRLEWIQKPEIEARWWKYGSVESFYQSNKVLQIR